MSGLKVVDLTRILAGPFCTMNLGDMGADIIKVEQPGRGDDTRNWGPPFVAGEAAYFLSVNRNKRSLTLDLKDERGKEILRQLIGQADVLIDNFKTGTLEGWGFTAGWMAEYAPQLVHCSITGYGDKGPKAGLPGYDFLLQAESGLMSITGAEDGVPQKLGVAIVDVCTGQYAAMSILAALNARNGELGKGQKIDISLYDTSLTMLINIAANHLLTGNQPGRFGNAHPSIVPYEIYKCRTGEIAVAVGNDTQFAKLADAVGRPAWKTDQRFRTNADRVANRIQFNEEFEDAQAARAADQWISVFQSASVPCSKINTVDEALSNPQTLADDMVVEADHSAVGAMKMVGIPYKFSATPAAVQSPPPLLGADTDDILRSEIGLSDGEIKALRDDGVV